MTERRYSRRTYLTGVVAACATGLAGCTGGGNDASSPDTSTDGTPPDTTGDRSQETTAAGERTSITPDGERIPVEGGDLGVDQDTVFRQLNELLETDVDPPDRIVVVETSFTGGAPELGDHIVGELITDEVKSVPGFSGTYSDGEVTMVTAGRAETDIEATLAHEYVHHIQSARGLSIGEIRNGEAGFIERALDEGGAVYVTEAYIDQYMDWEQLKADQTEFVESNYDGRFSLDESEIGSQIDYIEAGYRQLNAAERFFASPYYFGSQYLAGQLESVSEYFEVYETPPQTTEQLLHGYASGSEQPGDLAIDSGDLSEAPSSGFGRLGELRLRLSLRSELDEQTAAEAAKGWDIDEIVEVFPEDGSRKREYAWTIRMETESEYSELRDAVDAYLNSRAEHRGRYWTDEAEGVSLTVEDADERTLVLGVGSEAFVQSLTASVDGEAVVLESSL